MNTYQIVFIVTCFLLMQLVFVWNRYQSYNAFFDGLAIAVLFMNVVSAAVALIAAAVWLYNYLGTLS